MRILYGVCGEGMGHAIRSAVVGAHLRGLGHDVTYVCSLGRAHEHLKASATGRVIASLGTHMSLSRNRVQPEWTALGNALAQLTLGPMAHALTAAQVSKPDVAISDFDPWVARYAGLSGLPLVAVDNVHFMTRCTHPLGAAMRDDDDRAAAALMYPVVQGMVPDARRYIVTSFVPTGVSAPKDARTTSVHLPILRQETLAETRADLGHVVVYFNDKAEVGRLTRELQGLGRMFHVYGTDVKAPRQEGDVLFMPMGNGFLHDLATSHAAIAGAGFTTMTEAIYLGKPMLAVPFEGQYEQILNSNHLELAGYGERARHLTRATVGAFLGRVDVYKRQLGDGPAHDGNRALLRAVDEAIGA